MESHSETAILLTSLRRAGLMALTMHSELLTANRPMYEQPLAQIRDRIALARQQESRSHDLREYLQASLPRLHQAINLPAENPSEALHRFMVAYVEHVPDTLETATNLLKQSGMYNFCSVFLRIAEGFFLQPPTAVLDHTGFHALIDEAYLAHRLIEEMNDQLMVLAGWPLTHIDMTLSNVIVHNVLGEHYANQLDLAVHFAVETFFQGDSFDPEAFATLMKTHNPSAWSALAQSWSESLKQSAISVHLPG